MGVREMFSLFVTLELGAEEKKKNSLREAIKSTGGGGERADAERETAPSAGPLQGLATAFLVAIGCGV